MAEHAYTPDRRTPEIAWAMLDTRRIGAGLLAVLVGTGITAGAAASVADFVRTAVSHAKVTLIVMRHPG